LCLFCAYLCLFCAYLCPYCAYLCLVGILCRMIVTCLCPSG
jgi:hypothetical protein